MIRYTKNKIRQLFLNIKKESVTNNNIYRDENHFEDKISYSCWCCDSYDLYRIPPTYATQITAICKKCGLIQRKEKTEKNETSQIGFYYGSDYNSSYDNIVKRQLYASSLMHEYISFLSKYCNFKRINNYLDVGGAEGILAHLIKHYYPHIQVYSIDPDYACIQYGIANYNNVHFIHSSAEDLKISNTFDLITDIGAIYRTVDPFSVLLKYYHLLNKKGMLIIAGNLLEALQNARTGLIPDAFAFFDPPKNNVFQRSFFSRDLFIQFLSTVFEVTHYEEVRYSPFQFKNIPFFICKKANSIDRTRASKLSFFRTNLEAIKNYAYNITLSRIRRLYDMGIQRLAILGITFEADFLENACKEVGITVTDRLYPSLHEIPGKIKFEHEISDFRVFNNNSFDACIIADYKNQKKYEEVLRFCLIHHKHKIFRGFKVDNIRNIPVILNWIDKPILYRAFNFSQIVDTP